MKENKLQGYRNRYSKHYREIFTGDKLYMRAWYLIFPNRWFNNELHNIVTSDSNRRFHCHPNDFLAITLGGVGYELIRLFNKKTKTWGEPVKRKLGLIRFYRCEHQHRVVEIRKPMWTITISGPRRRVWGFSSKEGDVWIWRPYMQVRLHSTISPRLGDRSGFLLPVGHSRKNKHAIEVIRRQMQNEGRIELDCDKHGYSWAERKAA